MTKDMRSTIIVRIAVATVESVFLIPHFARMEVAPANSAEPPAKSTHILFRLRQFSLSRCGNPARLSVSKPGYRVRKRREDTTAFLPRAHPGDLPLDGVHAIRFFV